MLKKINSLILNYGLLILVFLLPLQTVYFLNLPWQNIIRWQFNQPAIYLTDLLIIILLILGFIKFEGGEGQNRWRLPLYIASLIWVLISIFGIYTAIDKPIVIFGTLRLFLMFSFTWLIINFGQAKKLIIAFLLGLSLSAILGLGQFYFQAQIANKYLGLSTHYPQELGTSVVQVDLTPTLSLARRGGNTQRYLRAYGSFQHPNILAGSLVFALILAFHLIISENKPRLRLIFGLGALIIILGLFFTFSRSGALAGLVGLLVLLAYYWKSGRRLWPYLLSILIILTALTYNYGYLWQVRASATSRLEQKSFDERALFLEQAKQLCMAKPIVGVGIMSYSSALQTDLNIINIYDRQPVHNTWWLVKTELGNIGLIIYLGWWLILGLAALQTLKQKQPLSLCLLVAALILSFYDHWLFSLHSGLLIFFFISGLIILQATNALDKSPKL